MRTPGRLAGRTVLVTRRREDAAPWARRLAAEGARGIGLPCPRIVPVEDSGLPHRLAAALGDPSCRWLALTSPRGADAVADLLRRAGGGPPSRVAVAAIGRATAARVSRVLGREPALVAPEGTGASLAAALAARVPASGRTGVVVAASDRGSREIEDLLVPRGVRVVRFAVYRTVPAPPRRPRIDLGALGVDTVFLASPSAVEGLLAQADVPPGVRLVAIGPVTSRAIRAAGLEPAGEARTRDLDGLIAAILPDHGEPDDA